LKKFVPKRRRLTEAEVGQVMVFSAVGSWKQGAIAAELGVHVEDVREAQAELGLTPNSTHPLPPETREKIRTMLARGCGVSEICARLCVLRYRVLQVMNESQRRGLTNAQKRRVRAEFQALTKVLASDLEVPARWIHRYVKAMP
jgi:hypothetical protein